MRLIDADKLHYKRVCIESEKGIRSAVVVFEKEIRKMQDAPTVDAEPVVRCKDCYYCRKYNEMWRFPKLDVLLCTRLYDGDGEEVSAEDYCSRGERKDETD